MTGQDKCDCLIEVTTWACLTVHSVKHTLKGTCITKQSIKGSLIFPM